MHVRPRLDLVLHISPGLLNLTGILPAGRAAVPPPVSGLSVQPALGLPSGESPIGGNSMPCGRPPTNQGQQVLSKYLLA
jgi:hypothetical protein